MAKYKNPVPTLDGSKVFSLKVKFTFEEEIEPVEAKFGITNAIQKVIKENEGVVPVEWIKGEGLY